MIRSRTILLATLLLGAAPALAEEPAHDAHHPGATAQQSSPPSGAMPGMMMQGGMMQGMTGAEENTGSSMMGNGMMQGPMMGRGMRNGMMGPGGGAMQSPMGGGMMSMMGMMAGPERMIGHVEGRLAYLKAELKITEKQQPLWTAFADALRGNAQAMNQRMGQMMSMRSAPLPERVEAREALMSDHLDALRRTKAALLPLYAALSDEQKKTADELLMPMPGGFGVM